MNTLKTALSHALRPLLLSLTVVFFVSNVGCKKKTDLTSNTYSAIDHTTADNELTNVFNMADDQAKNGNGKTGAGTLIPSCATVTIDSLSVNGKTVFTVDFGSTDCACYDGVKRRGKVIMTLTGNYRTAGSTLDVRVQDYYVNGNKVEGTKKITNLGNSSGNFKYSEENRNVVITTPEGIITWQADKIIERIAGDATLTPYDDIYTITGNASGINRIGDSYTVEVKPATPLKRVIKLGCRHLVSGIITLKTGGSTFAVNFDPIGGELCDNVASLTIDGGNPITFLMN